MTTADICDVLDTGVASFADQERAAAELRQTRNERDEAERNSQVLALLVADLESDLAAAVELLRPFARYAECLPPVVDGEPRITDDDGIALYASVMMHDYTIRFRDIRAARAFLEAVEKRSGT